MKLSTCGGKRIGHQIGCCFICGKRTSLPIHQKCGKQAEVKRTKNQEKLVKQRYKNDTLINYIESAAKYNGY